MTFKEGTHLDHLKGIQEVVTNPEVAWPYGPFMWEEDIFEKVKGIYRPVGRIILPMSVEAKRDPNFGDKAVAFTVLDREYFEGNDAENGYDCFSDWQGRGMVDTYTRSTNPYSIVKSHITNILGNFDKISKQARELKVEDLVKRMFVKY
jgi:hypothetical protein